MIKYIFVFIFLTFSFYCIAQPVTDWVNKFYSGGNSTPHDVKVDTLNHFIYIGGRMKFGGYTFIGAGDTITTPYYGKKDAFIAKYSTTGELIWANTVGSVNNDETAEVAFDLQGNSYMCGQFKDTLYFGTDTLFSSGLFDVFIIKFNSLGNVVWGKNFGGIKNDYAASIVCDFESNVYITGSVESSFIYEGTPVNGTGGELYVLKLDPEGNLSWVKSSVSNGSNTKIYGKSIRIGKDSTINIVGDFQKSMSFSDSLVSVQGGKDIFALKLHSNGEIQWLKSFGGTGMEIVAKCELDSDGDILVTGNFTGTVLLNEEAYSSEGVDNDSFIMKFTSSGEISWFTKFGGVGRYYGEAICIDQEGNGYMDGYGFGVMTEANDTSIYSVTDPHIFIIKFDSLGTVHWIKQYGQTSYSRAHGIGCDQFLNVFYSGMFISSIDLDTVHLETNYPNQFWTNSFIAKLYQKLPLTATANQDVLCFNDTVLITLDDYKPWVNYRIELNGGQLISQNNDSMLFKVNQSGYLNAVIYGDRGESVDSVYIDSLLFVYPEIVLNLNDEYLCVGDSTLLVLPDNLERILWSTGDTTASITVYNQETFTVSVVDSNFCSVDDTVSVFVFPAIELNLIDRNICPGDSTELILPEDLESILWSTGDTTASITVYNQETISVSVVDSNLCIVDDTVSVFVFPDIELNLVDESICFGDSVIIGLEHDFSSILWSTGDTTVSVTVYDQGVYDVVVVDTNGCITDDTFAVVVHPLAEPNLGNDSLLCIGELLTLFTTLPYIEYLWNTGSVDDHITVDQNGEYDVMVVDENGCHGVDTILVQFEVCLGISESQVNQLIVYPNPASTVINISTSFEMIGKEFYLYNLFGELVYSGIITDDIFQIDISKYASGIYNYSIRLTGVKGKVIINR